jgi:hypothetical protein
MQDAKVWSTAGLSSWTSFVLNIYINDLPQTVEVGQLVLFADDINLLIIGKDEKELQHKVNEVMKKLQ